MEPTEQKVEFNHKSDELSHHIIICFYPESQYLLKIFYLFLKMVICALNVIKFFEIIISSFCPSIKHKNKAQH